MVTFLMGIPNPTFHAFLELYTGFSDYVDKQSGVPFTDRLRIKGHRGIVPTT
jgi:hypothetical protein